MKVAILSDIHGNLEALKTVLADISGMGVNRIYCLGDIVGYGPYPSECLELIRRYATVIIGGNHEEMTCNFIEWQTKLINFAALKGIEHALKNLSTEQLDFLKRLSDKMDLTDLDMTLVHGGFAQPHRWGYIDLWQEAKEHLTFFSSKTGVCGHTHKPFLFIPCYDEFFRKSVEGIVFDRNERVIVNVGSVGQPRDGDPRASYGLFEYTDKSVSLSIIRLAYDIEKTVKAIKDAQLPERTGQRLFEGR